MCKLSQYGKVLISALNIDIAFMAYNIVMQDEPTEGETTFPTEGEEQGESGN